MMRHSTRQSSCFQGLYTWSAKDSEHERPVPPRQASDIEFSLRHYIRGILEGLSKANEDQSFDWTPVLNFCSWVVAKPVKIEGRKVNLREADPDWGWSRQTLIRLLSSGLKDGTNPLPLDLRMQVWTIISVLTEDFTNPGPEEELKNLENSRVPIGVQLIALEGKLFDS